MDKPVYWFLKTTKFDIKISFEANIFGLEKISVQEKQFLSAVFN